MIETRLYHGDIVGLGLVQLQYFSSASAPQPLPTPSRKTVDLSGGSVSSIRPSSFSASPFGRNRQNKTKTLLQIMALGFGVVAIILIGIFIYTILFSGK